MAPPAFTVFYQYAFGSLVGIFVLFVVLCCIRARILERRRLRDELQARDDLEEPRLFDVYLDGQGELWPEIIVRETFAILCMYDTVRSQYPFTRPVFRRRSR